MDKKTIDKIWTIGVIGWLFVVISYYLFYTLVQRYDSIQALAKLFTVSETFIAIGINVLFIIFLSLTVATFLHYIFFELKMSNFYRADTKMKIEDDIRATLDTQDEGQLAAIKKKIEGDETFFAESVRRLSIDHFAGPDTLTAFFRANIEEEFFRVRRNLMFLGLTAVQAPALGFLGTAVGMVKCFYEIALKQFVTPGDLAGSIQFALITTVLGLIIKTISSLAQAVIVRMISTREQFLLDRFDEIVLTDSE